MDENLKYFKDLVLPHTLKVKDNPFVEIDVNTRIYYLLDPNEGNGFEFAVMQYNSVVVNDDKYVKGISNFDQDSFKASTLFHGVALYDGIRHLYMGDPTVDDHGYLYYPEMVELIKIFTELHKLETTYCKYCEKDKL